MSVLIMTATVDSGYFGNVGTKIQDTEKRREQYEDALDKYICQSNFKKIVFAENSGYMLNEEYYSRLADEHGKQIEFLSLIGDKKLMSEKGKSYGEAKLISDAVSVSKLLKGEKSFYKVTGRVWVNNINKLINEKAENRFIAHNFKSWVLTSFFKIRVDDFNRCLKTAYTLCDDTTVNYEWCVEHVYFECLKNALKPVRNFFPYPDLRGINSGSGALYTKSKKKLLIRNIVSLLRLNKFDKRNHHYYSWLLKIEEERHKR